MAPVTLTIRRNGSIKVEGPIQIVDSNGKAMALPADKPILSLCRCGHSKNKPFCDGSHREANFQGAEAHILAAEATAGPPSP